MGTKTTVLRVKRHRDEPPPPETFLLRPTSLSVSHNARVTDSNNGTYRNKRKKQKEKEESNNATYLTSLMHNSTFLNDQLSSSSTSKPWSNQNGDQIVRNDSHQTQLDDRKDSIIDKTDNNKGSHNNRKAIVFRRVVDGEISTSNSNMEYNKRTSSPSVTTATSAQETTKSKKKRKLDMVHVVNARLDSTRGTQQPGDEFRATNEEKSKRKRISLQMVDTLTMTQSEFFNIQQASSSLAKRDPGQKMSTPKLRTQINRASSSLPSSPLRNQQRSNVILDPVLKQIDESLRSLTEMTQNTTTPIITLSKANSLIAAHHQLLQRQQQSSLSSMQSVKKYLNWKCTNGIGTILHVAVLLNSVEAVRDFCRMYLDVLDMDATDGEGRTALHLAEICGSIGALEVLALYQGLSVSASGRATTNVTNNSNVSTSGWHGERETKAEERDADYVFDLYCLTGDEDDEEKEGGDDGNVVECRGETFGNERGVGQRDVMIPDEKKELSKDEGDKDLGIQPTRSTFSESISGDSFENNNHSSIRPTVEMCGGVGYWNQHGELVLEVVEPIAADFYSKIEDEYDSNCESHEGNEYPDEDEGLGEMTRGYYSRSDSFDHVENTGLHFGENALIIDGIESSNSLFINEESRGYLSSDDEENEDNNQNFRNLPVDLANYQGDSRGYGFYNSNNYDEGYIDYAMGMDGRDDLSSRLYAEAEYAYDPDLDGE